MCSSDLWDQMAHERSNLVPGLSLGHQNRNERVPQGVITIQPLEVRVLHQLLEQTIRLVATTLLNRSLAFPLPSLVAARVIELIEDREHDLAALGQPLDVLPQRLGHRVA